MGTLSPEKVLKNILAEVRNYLRDFPQLNRLIQGEETTDFQLRWHIAEVLDDFSTTPPPLGFFTVSSVPRSILLKGVVAEVLKSAAILNLRNSLAYTDGSVSVNLDKHQELLRVSQMFSSEYESKVLAYKVSLNLRRALGRVDGVPSEYYYFSEGYYGSI